MINLESYYEEITNGLDYELDQQKQVLTDLRQSINTYLSDHPEATLEEIYETFGTPEKIIKDNERYIPKILVKKTAAYKYWILGIVVVAVLSLCVFMAIILVDGHKANNGHAVVEGGEITTSDTAATATGPAA